jgi:rubredoxin-NAD+ reductase
MDPIIIVGAGMAAYNLARELRKQDRGTPLLIIARDAGASYAKPMLSNAFALGKQAAELLSASAGGMAQQLDATVLPHTTVTAIDSAAKTIATASSGTFRYSKLVLALGAQPIRLALAGSGAGAVLSVNNLDDYGVLRQQLAQVPGPARVAILGAGLIGCEFADDLAGAGHHVTIIDPNPRPLAALAAPSLSQALQQAWLARSISLRLGTTASSVERAGAGSSLRLGLADGSSIDADVVVSAVGLRPAIALAAASGLATRRGIVVDAFGQTSAAGIYALGDCAEYEGAGVLPYVAPLLAAARAVARTLAGTPTPIALGQDAILVKTASYRLALAPPPAGSEGSWVDALQAPHTIARFIDSRGVLRGYGVAPFTPALRKQLQEEMAQPSAQ